MFPADSFSIRTEQQAQEIHAEGMLFARTHILLNYESGRRNSTYRVVVFVPLAHACCAFA